MIKLDHQISRRLLLAAPLFAPPPGSATAAKVFGPAPPGHIWICVSIVAWEKFAEAARLLGG